VGAGRGGGGGPLATQVSVLPLHVNDEHCGYVYVFGGFGAMLSVNEAAWAPNAAKRQLPASVARKATTVRAFIGIPPSHSLSLLRFLREPRAGEFSPHGTTVPREVPTGETAR
jgi:hypothetical protein